MGGFAGVCWREGLGRWGFGVFSEGCGGVCREVFEGVVSWPCVVEERIMGRGMVMIELNEWSLCCHCFEISFRKCQAKFTKRQTIENPNITGILLLQHPHETTRTLFPVRAAIVAAD